MTNDYVIKKDTPVRVVAKNKKGLLFEVDPRRDYDSNSVNVIYINGSQLDHYDRKGKTIFNHCAENTRWGHVGDWYSDNVKPYIFKYIVDEDKDGSKVFSESLIELLKSLDTDQNIVVGKSYGGAIAGHAAQSSLVSNVHMINPSIMGSSLFNLTLMRYNCHSFTDLGIYLCCNRVVEPGMKFTEENYKGVHVENSPKIHVYGGAINDLKPNTMMERIMHMSADKIYELTGLLSDGVTIWDERYIENRGFDYTLMDRPYHHRTSHEDYMGKIYKKSIKR